VASRTIRQRLCASLCAALLAPLSSVLTLPAQDATPPGQSTPSAPSALVPLHGVVRNAATGEPLPRALVQIEGDADTGALTGGDGRFEISAVPAGPQVIQVRKPGFLDTPAADGSLAADSLPVDPMIGPGHTVWVASDMPDVVFSLAPTSAIQGQVSLSSGDPAAGITIELARQTGQDGRSLWQAAGSAKTSSDGNYRFAALADGVYAVFTDPTLDSDTAATLVETGSGAAVEREGYPIVFYPDARDPSGASRIRLRGGQPFQANLTLTLEPFHAVVATAVLPPSASTPAARDSIRYSAIVMDPNGRQLAYRALFDAETRTIQALLPDGAYSLLVSSVPHLGGSPSSDDPGPLLGAVDFSVAGRAVANLRVPVAAQAPSPVQLTIQRGETAPSSTQSGLTSVLLSLDAGWIDDGMVSAFASGSDSGPMHTVYTLPGAYWVHTHVQPGLCESSFTAGGASLAREPLLIGLSGSSAPMDLALRNDCSRLTLHLPQSLAALTLGEEPFYTVYAVPDFDSTADVEPLTLRPSTGGSMTLSDLTPGPYHVYTFAAPVRLAYRNPAVLAALATPGQPITLSPGVAADLVLEVPGQ
jgi:hypothetical protein